MSSQHESDSFPTAAIATSDDEADGSDGNTLWTTRNILTRHSHAARVRAENFLTLSATTTTTSTTIAKKRIIK